MQPFSTAVSRGNELHITNSPSASSLIFVRNYSRMCVHVACTSRCYYSRVAFISLRASECAATIQGQWLFEGGIYSKKYCRLSTSTCITVKSRPSAHGCSQLKPKKLGVAPYTENLLERLNYLLASAHPRVPNLLRRSQYVQHKL